jgi:hypothetical protein
MLGSSTNNDYNADISYVYVELTPAVARRALRRIAELRRLKEKEPRVIETYYFDDNAVYLRYEQVGRRDTDAVGKYLTVEVKASSTKTWEGENVECNQMVATDSSIYFTAIPKHSNIYIVSEHIGVDMLREASKRKSPKKTR